MSYELSFQGYAQIVLENKDGKTSKNTLKECNIRLGVGDNLDEEAYTKDGDLTLEGTKALTYCFVSGLAANIAQAHENGIIDSAEHLRHVMAELEKAFVVVAKVEKGQMRDL